MCFDPCGACALSWRLEQAELYSWSWHLTVGESSSFEQPLPQPLRFGSVKCIQECLHLRLTLNS